MTILLVRPRLIGDVILTTPSIQALRRRFPDAKLLYLVEALAAPIVANNPHINETFVIRHRRGWRRWLEDLRLARELRSRHIDVALLPWWHLGSDEAFAVVQRHIAPRRIVLIHVAPSEEAEAQDAIRQRAPDAVLFRRMLADRLAL